MPSPPAPEPPPRAGLAVGQPVASMNYMGFAEYAVLGAKHALPLPRATPQMVALLTSGLTASIGGWLAVSSSTDGGLSQSWQAFRVLGCMTLGTPV